MNREETKRFIKEAIGPEVRKIAEEAITNRREILGRAAALGMEDKAREMFEQGATEQEVASALLDSLPKAGDNRSTGTRSPYRNVDEIPDDVFARAICSPVAFSFDDGGTVRPGETSRQHTRTEAPSFRKVEDLPDDDFARAICNPFFRFA